MNERTPEDPERPGSPAALAFLVASLIAIGFALTTLGEPCAGGACVVVQMAALLHGGLAWLAAFPLLWLTFELNRRRRMRKSAPGVAHSKRGRRMPE